MSKKRARLPLSSAATDQPIEKKQRVLRSPAAAPMQVQADSTEGLSPEQVPFHPRANFIGWQHAALPHWARKADLHPASSSRTISGKAMCVACKRDIWRCDPREDLCEEDSYRLAAENRDLRATRDTRSWGGIVNPWADQKGGVPIAWPK